MLSTILLNKLYISAPGVESHIMYGERIKWDPNNGTNQ